MLTAVRLKDFKNHVDTEIPLGRLTCLVGPNGCGKTSVLEGIAFACTSLASGAIAFFQPPCTHEDYIRRGADSLSVRMESVGGPDNEHWMALTLTLSKGAPRDVSEEELDKWGDRFPSYGVKCDWETNLDRQELIRTIATGEWSGISASDGKGDELTMRAWRPRGLAPEFADLPPTAFLFKPEAPKLRSASYSPDEVPYMAADGATLASVIAYLITTEPDRFAALLARIREVLPAVERLRVRPAKVELIEPTKITVNRKEIPYTETREVMGHELLFDLKGAPGVPARAVSEGTLLVTALLTATVWNQGADVLLIDDLEKGLHPKAQRELVMALKALLDTDPKLQIGFSTHSPYVVDELSADQVCILVPDEERGVVARRLSDHPRAADALQVLTTGEFLSAEGEDWVREVPDAA